MRLTRRAFLGLLPVLASPFAFAAGPTGGAIPLPGGISDLVGRTGVLIGPTGALEVVDLISGELLWETKEAQRPVMILGDRLYAQASAGPNELRLLGFDLKDQGPCVYQSRPLPLPRWVSVNEAPGRSFDAHWRLERGQLAITWEASAGPGREPPQMHLMGRGAQRYGPPAVQLVPGLAKDLEPARREASGRAAFDLESGLVTELPVEVAPVPAPPPDHAQKRILRWQGEVRGHYSAVVQEPAGGQQALVLRAWDRLNGKEILTRELQRGRRLVLQPTLDGRLLAIHDSMPSPDVRLTPAELAQRCDWSVYSPETGEKIARVPFEPGAQSLALVGGRAYYLTSYSLRGTIDRPLVRPQTLKAVDLKTGKILWTRRVEGKKLTPPAS